MCCVTVGVLNTDLGIRLAAWHGWLSECWKRASGWSRRIAGKTLHPPHPRHTLPHRAGQSTDTHPEQEKENRSYKAFKESLLKYLISVTIRQKKLSNGILNYGGSATIKYQEVFLVFSRKTKSILDKVFNRLWVQKITQRKALSPINHHYWILKQQGGINTCLLREMHFITKKVATELQPIYMSTNAEKNSHQLFPTLIIIALLS